MKTSQRIPLLSLILLASFISVSMAIDESQVHAKQSAMLAGAKISTSKALELARQEFAGGVPTSVEILTETDTPQYRTIFYFPNDGASRYADIDGVSGSILKKDTAAGAMVKGGPFTESVLNAKLKLEQAIDIAAKKYPTGQVVSAAVSLGRNFQYRVFMNVQGKFTEVRVNPEDGSIIEIIVGK